MILFQDGRGGVPMILYFQDWRGVKWFYLRMGGDVQLMILFQDGRV